MTKTTPFSKHVLIFFFLISILSCSKKDLVPEIEPEVPVTSGGNYTVTQALPLSTVIFTDEMVLKNLKSALITNEGFLITTSEDTVKIWDYKSKKIVNSFIPIPKYPVGIALSNDESYLYVCTAIQSMFYPRPVTIQLFNWKKGTFIKSIPTSSTLTRFKVSDDDKYILFNDPTNVEIWDIENSKQISRINGVNTINDAAISRNAEYTAISDYNSVKVWSLQNGRNVLIFSLEGSHFKNVGFNHDNTQLICKQIDGDEVNLSIYDFKKNILLKKITGEEIYNVILSGDGRYCFTGDHYIDLETKGVVWENHVPDALGISLSKNGKNAIYYHSNGTIDFFENRQKVEPNSSYLTGQAESGSVSSEKFFVRTNREIKGYDLKGGNPVTFQNTTGNNFKNRLESAGNYLISQTCEKIFVWDTDGHLDKTIDIPDNNKYSFCGQRQSISESSSLVAFKNPGDLNSAFVYNLKSGQKTGYFSGLYADQSPVIISDDGNFLIGKSQTREGTFMSVWNISNGNLEKPLDPQSWIAESANFCLSNDNKTFAICTNNNILLFDFPTRKIKYGIRLLSEGNVPEFVRFSPDGNHLVYAGNGIILIIDITKDIAKKAKLNSQIINIGFNKAGHLLVITPTELISFNVN